MLLPMALYIMFMIKYGLSAPRRLALALLGWLTWSNLVYEDKRYH